MRRPALLPVIAALLVFLSSCVSEPWGAVQGQSPAAGELKALFKQRQEAGVLESRRRIRALFPEPQLMRAVNPEAAAAAEKGELETASAAWWGWNGKNDTEALRRAMLAPVEVLVIPSMPGAWTSGPLELDGPRSLLFEPGAVIQALPGAFRERKEYLISAFRVRGLTIRGYGARLVMRKEEYTRPPYVWSQWRHALALLESRQVHVEGLSIERSGGDGVYIGQSRGGEVPRDIRLTDLRLIENHRQGVSVISVDGFLMEYTYIAGTRGVPPSAAIDFEPNSGRYGITDSIVSSCLFERNAGAALTIHMENQYAYHPPVSIRIEDTVIAGYPLAIWLGGLGNGIRGRVEFVNSRVSGLGYIQRSEVFSVVR